MTDDPLLWSVDRSWGNVATKQDGEPIYSTKFHLDRGDTTAKCSRRILLNSLPGEAEAAKPQDLLSRFERWAAKPKNGSSSERQRWESFARELHALGVKHRDAVLALHPVKTFQGRVYCAACATPYWPVEGPQQAAWPCETARAVGVARGSEEDRT